jgi:carbon-monoxide dehydrogenase catalytic subunit
MDPKERSSDKAAQEMIKRMAEAGIANAWDRLEAQLPQCGFGKQGVCCRICAMGPCRITKKAPLGVCGADVDTIVARNFLRAIAAGVSAHSDHGRTVAEVFLATANGEAKDYQIKDTIKLHKLALELGVEVKDRSANEIAVDVGKIALAEFGKSEGTQLMARRAPATRQEIWKKLGITPRAVDREVTESLHRSTMGVDQDYKNILTHASRVALADGWGGAMLATELQDVLFGTPYPGRGEVNMGVLKEDQVNIIVHGHEPILSEMIAMASQDAELLAEAKKVGASGINVAGTCCTANELLMRHGIPIAGNFLNQELVISTGAIELMAVDVQCVMQGLTTVANCYHTKLVTTADKAKMPGVEHVSMEEATALDTAKELVKTAIGNYKNRGEV